MHRRATKCKSNSECKRNHSKPEKFIGGTIFFINKASKYFWFYNRVSLSTKEMLVGKHNFERNIIRKCATITGYHADNGIHKANEFRH